MIHCVKGERDAALNGGNTKQVRNPLDELLTFYIFTIFRQPILRLISNNFDVMWKQKVTPPPPPEDGVLYNT